MPLLRRGTKLDEPGLLDLADRQHGSDRVDLLVGRQHLDHEILESSEVFGDAMQQEIAVAGHHPGLPHEWPAGGRGRECLQVRLRLVFQPHHAEGDEIEPEGGRVQQRMIALDDARFLQLADAPQAGRRGNSRLAREFHIGHAAVGLQFLEDPDVDGVEVGTEHGRTLP